MHPVTVGLSFMPAFYTKHLGIQYGEAYYFDPEHRDLVERSEQRLLYELFGAYQVGHPEPQASGNLFIQPVDLLMRIFGAEWRFPDNASVESRGTPWGDLTVEEIARIDAREAAHHPIINDILAQYSVLERMYGERADLYCSKDGSMIIHTPYTSAHQLCGEALFMLMIEEPEDARRIFRKIWEIYQAIFARIAETTGARFTKVHLGDCSASMLSEVIYRETVLPVNQMIAEQFEGVNYHSCGPSTQIVSAVAEIPHLTGLQYGHGTDLAQSVRLTPTAKQQPLLDPVMPRVSDPDTMAATVQRVLDDCAHASSVEICAWSFDQESQLDNVTAMLKTIQRYNEEHIT